MQDLIVGLGFAFILEGILWALFPHQARKMVMQIAGSPENMMRTAGLSSVILGVLIVYLVRTFGYG